MSPIPDSLTHRQTLKDRATRPLRSRKRAFVTQYSPPPILSRCFACVKKIKISLGLKIMEVVFIGSKEHKNMFLWGFCYLSAISQLGPGHFSILFFLQNQLKRAQYFLFIPYLAIFRTETPKKRTKVIADE